MRVLMICPELPTAQSPGTMAAAARQIQSLRDLGIDVHVVDMRGIPKLKYLQVLPKIRRLAARVDVIHAHFGYCGWLAKLAPFGSFRAKPLVVSFMGDDLLGTPYNAEGDLEWFSRCMVRCNRYLPRLAEAVIVKSHEMAQVLAPWPCTVIPNGVDTEVFRPLPRLSMCQQLQLPSEIPLVLFPGDPDNPRKGFALATAAVQVAEQQLNQRIRLLPLKGIAPDLVASYMNACHAMLMTSLIEGSPNVVKEALACDLPVVGVPVGDVHEMLHGVAGCAPCGRDAQELGAALASLLAAGQRAAGRQAIFDRQLDLVSVARRVQSIYHHVLGNVERPTATRPATTSPQLCPTAAGGTPEQHDLSEVRARYQQAPER